MDHRNEHENGNERPARPPEIEKRGQDSGRQDRSGKPVMDVHMPKPANPAPSPAPVPEPKPEPATPTQPKPADLSRFEVPKDEPEQPEMAPEPTRDEKPKAEPKPVINKPPKPPKQPGVGLAVFATIVVVVVLSALATYAYLKTNGVKVP
jgi:hypothetical protein